jgi:hypothetical protein
VLCVCSPNKGFAHSRVLNLQRNNLSGTDLNKLLQLEELRMDSNDLSGVVTYELCGMRNSFLGVFVADCGGFVSKVTCPCCTECY